jgi:MerR family transcriptional regulator, redox-sensitive transcriptional activator SoxR
MKIGELARRTGISTSAIRYYEEEGLLPRAARLSGQRSFDDRSLLQLVVVQLAKDAGFTLAEIRQLVTEFRQHRWRRLAERKLVEIAQASARLATMKRLLARLLRCSCFDLEVCGRALQKHGLHRRLGAAVIPSRLDKPDRDRRP